MTKNPDPRLAPAIIPFNCQELYSTFCKLRRSATNAITYTEIKAYEDVMGTKLLPREVETIILWDQVFINKRYDVQKNSTLTVKE